MIQFPGIRKELYSVGGALMLEQFHLCILHFEYGTYTIQVSLLANFIQKHEEHEKKIFLYGKNC